MQSRRSIPKLKAAMEDPDPSVALAAAHSLDLMHDNSAFEVYYGVLNGERKAGKGLLASQASRLHDPKKMAELGFEEGIGFIPFAGIGWGAIKAIRKDDASPVRAAAPSCSINSWMDCRPCGEICDPSFWPRAGNIKRRNCCARFPASVRFELLA